MTRYTPSDFTTDELDSLPVSQRVVRAVAAETDRDPVALERLYDVVDPESLNSLFEPTKAGSLRMDGAVTFDYAGCEVAVYANGTVDVDPAASTRSGAQTSSAQVE